MTRDHGRLRKGLTRRRFVTIAAVAASLPVWARASAPVARWTGTAMGAQASMALVGLDDASVRTVFAAVEAEVARLEDIFSLYRETSALSRLNRDGRLDAPPADMVRLMRLCNDLHRATRGAFDPTVQPLWQIYAAAAVQARLPSGNELARTRGLVGWANVEIGDRSVRFARAGMALTFNGIAQGYIADRVAGLLRNRGLTSVLIDMGEITALGRHPDDRAWRADIAAPDGETIGRVDLEDRALATSAPMGTLLDRSGRVGHILDPRTGRPGGGWRTVSVSAASAALADGLSTAFCVMPRTGIDQVLAAHPEATLKVLD